MTGTVPIVIMKFGAREHMEDFRKNGTLHMSPLKTFREIEESHKMHLRKDVYEGADHFYQGNQIQIKINTPEGKEIILDSSNGLLHARIGYNSTLEIKVFCMYAVKLDGSHPYIHEDNFNFGDTAAIITDLGKFIDRLMEAAKKNNYRLQARLVEYFDENQYHGEMGIFRKPKAFSYQSEYRIALNVPGTDPIKLCIGDLSDICVLCDLQKINSLIEVDYPLQESV